jgi:hypothetical protein
VLPSGEQKAAGAVGRIVDRFPRLGIHNFHRRVDQRPRREILPCTWLDLPRVAFEKALVNRAFDVDAKPSQVSCSMRPTSHRNFAGSCTSFCAFKKIVPTMPEERDSLSRIAE